MSVTGLPRTSAPGSGSAVEGKLRLDLRHYALLAIAALALFVPGLARLPPMDRDEARYLQATTQMLQTHDFIDVRFQDEPRYLQPAGIYWLQSASVSLFSTPEARQPWAYRLPSLTGAVASVLMTAWIGSTLFGGAAGMVGGMFVGGPGLVWGGRRVGALRGP